MLGEIDNIKVDGERTLSPVQVLTDKIVQVDNFLGASDNFQSRQSSKSAPRGCEIKPSKWKFGERPPVSMEVSDGSNDSIPELSSWDDTQDKEKWCWFTEKDLGLHELFQEPDDWEDIYM